MMQHGTSGPEVSEEWISVGRLLRPFGIKGDIKCEPLTHDLKRHKLLKQVRLLSPSGTHRVVTVQRSSLHGVQWHLVFDGFDNPEIAKTLCPADVQIPLTQRIPAPAGQYYFSDLEGFAAVDEQRQVHGKVLSVEEFPSVNAFRVQIKTPTHGMREVLAPWVDACVVEIDVAQRQVVFHLEYLQELLEN